MLVAIADSERLATVGLGEHVLDGAGELAGGAIDRLVDRAGVLGDRGRLVVLDASLHHAALVVLADLAAILVGDVHLDARDPLAEVREGVLDHLLHVRRESLGALDVMVRVQLDLHHVQRRDECGPCQPPRAADHQ